MRIAAAVLALLATPALAQDEPAWTVYAEGAEACYAVSAPIAQVNTRNGEEVEVNRGVTRLMVAWRPEDGVLGQVSFTGGYPFDADSTVTLEAGAETFDLVVEGEWAWPATAEGDASVIAQLRGAGEVDLVGTSSRGTTTRDTFALLGFGAAVDEASRRCTED